MHPESRSSNMVSVDDAITVGSVGHYSLSHRYIYVFIFLC